MTTADPIAEINAKMEDAVAAQEAGDYASALKHMETAYMRICVLPDSEFDNERLQWDRERIQALIKYLQSKVASATTSGAPRGTLIRPNEVTYKRG